MLCRGGKSCSSTWLRAGDILLGFCVFLPCQVLFWRGVWDLYDLYVLPDDDHIGSWVSLGIAVVGRVLYCLIQLPLDRYFERPARSKSRRVFLLIHNFLFALMVIHHWRGLWNLLDIYTGYGIFSNALCMALSWLLMCALRCTNMALSSPFYVVLDTRPEAMVSEARFRTPRSTLRLHIPDQLFTFVFCYSSAIAFWRSLWNLEDESILPHRFLASNVISVAAGYILAGILLILEYPVQRLAASLDNRFLLKLFLEYTFTFFGCVAVISQWRGLWNLAEHYVFPEQPLGGAVSIVIGGVPLWAAGCASSAYDITIVLDGSFTKGEGCTWDIQYLQELFETEDKEVEKEVTDLEVKSATDLDACSDEDGDEERDGWATPYISSAGEALFTYPTRDTTCSEPVRIPRQSTTVPPGRGEIHCSYLHLPSTSTLAEVAENGGSLKESSV